MLNSSMYDIIQNNFTDILAVKDCNLCVHLWANQEENGPKHFFSSTFPLKKMFFMILFSMIKIYKEYIKIFPCNSKSVQPQRASF